MHSGIPAPLPAAARAQPLPFGLRFFQMHRLPNLCLLSYVPFPGFVNLPGSPLLDQTVEVGVLSEDKQHGS
jgi:hypothetical protein